MREKAATLGRPPALAMPQDWQSKEQRQGAQGASKNRASVRFASYFRPTLGLFPVPLLDPAHALDEVPALVERRAGAVRCEV